MQIPCVYLPGPAPAVSVANMYSVRQRERPGLKNECETWWFLSLNGRRWGGGGYFSVIPHTITSPHTPAIIPFSIAAPADQNENTHKHLSKTPFFAKLLLAQKSMRSRSWESRMRIWAWNEEGLLMEEIAKLLGRYTSLLYSLVVKARNLPSPSKNSFVEVRKKENTPRSILKRWMLTFPIMTAYEVHRKWWNCGFCPDPCGPCRCAFSWRQWPHFSRLICQ
jgi:hypothetical protein